MHPHARRIGCILLPFLGTLLAAFVLYALLLRPTLLVLDARDWTPTEARIVSSEVVRIPSSGTRTSHRLAIEYAYTVNGRELTSTRYDAIADNGPGNYDHKQQLVARYRPGMSVTCYVNPDDPAEALLHRGFPARMWWGVLPLTLLPCAILGLILGIILRRQ